MENLIAREGEHKSFKYKIYYDEYAEDPIDNCIFTFYSNNRNFYRGFDIEQIMSLDGEGLDENFKEKNYFITVYAAIHSSINIRTERFNDYLDSGLCGILAIRKDDREVEGLSEEKVIVLMKWFVNDKWAKYLAGECCRYEIYYPDGDVCDSLCGFYDVDYCERVAKNEIDCVVNDYYRTEKITIPCESFGNDETHIHSHGEYAKEKIMA